jgi:hypothetical protein
LDDDGRTFGIGGRLFSEPLNDFVIERMKNEEEETGKRKLENWEGWPIIICSASF